MSEKSVLSAFFVATIIAAGGTAWAATNASPPTSQPSSAAIKAFGKLSADGTRAFQDVRLTRLAIYDGDVAKAKTLVDDAANAFAKAQHDDSVFMKDESQMKTAADIKNQPTGSLSTNAQDASGQKAGASGSVAWLPVEGTITLNEAYSLSPAKKSAVAEANQSLAKGDRAGAIDKLRLAHVQTTATLEVVPIKQTINDV